MNPIIKQGEHSSEYSRCLFEILAASARDITSSCNALAGVKNSTLSHINVRL